jgi:protein-disulfide isomerase
MNKKIILPIFVLIFLSMAVIVSAASDNPKTLGDPSAELTMEIYTDFQDPFSARWYEQTLPQLQEEYIGDEDLKIVFRHFPLSFHADAMDRAKATECAAEQGYFFAFVEKFYNNLDKDTDMDYYEAIANGLGVDDFDFSEFKECFNDDNTEDEINSEFDKGQNRGVRGVPDFFIKNQQISGAQPFSEFERVIDSLLGGDDDDEEPNPEDMQREPVRGDGKVEIIGYMGYNDPFSKRSWKTLDELFREFGENKLSFEFRNFPLTFQDEDYKLAQTGECVLGLSNSQTFFKFSSLVMGGKDALSSSVEVGLSRQDVENCVSNKKFLPEILDDLENGENDGVQGTPTFFINDKKVFGAQPYDIFARMIKSELGETSEEVEIPVEETPSEDAPVSGKPIEEVEEGEQCVSGCQIGNSCLQFGQRIEMEGIDSYCAFSGNFEAQKQLDESCQNNYECFSNQCSNKQCVDIQQQLQETQNLIQKILDWLKSIFG